MLPPNALDEIEPTQPRTVAPRALPRVDEHLARVVFTSFVLTFIAARVVVFLIMARRIPDLYLHSGGTHIHHLNYGIFLLSGAGAYLIFARPTGRRLLRAAVVYSVGLALTFDEFGMWLHLGGSYWQRASFDAVTVIAAILGLVAFAPKWRAFTPKNWAVGVVMAVALLLFGYLLVDSFHYAKGKLGPRLQRIELQAPQ